MAFRPRTRFSQVSKIVGVVFAVAGVMILIKTLPQWFWFFLFGVMLIAFGWMLYFRR